MNTIALPSTPQLVRLARKGHFPLRREQIEQMARRGGRQGGMIPFLRLFPQDEIFESKTDFLTRCEELELFIREELSMPKEKLQSPQDL